MPHHEVLDWVRGALTGFPHAVSLPMVDAADVPADVMVRTVHSDPLAGVFYVLLEHASFPDVPDGEAPPAVGGRFGVPYVTVRLPQPVGVASGPPGGTPSDAAPDAIVGG